MLKVLIIDDDAIVLFVQEKMLNRCGFSDKLYSFKEAPNALKFLQDQSTEEEFLILLDINMPKMNGWEFLDALEEYITSENIQVIMVSSSIDQYDKQKAENYQNVIGFIEKPITAENCKKIKSFPKLKKYF